MALTEITKVTGPGIHTLSNILSHNINSSGIITATEFDGKFSGNIVGTAATFSGNVTIGGTLTYEDVTNIDSVGIITGKGADINGDLDVDGHTNLDNVSIAGVTTFSDHVSIGVNSKKLRFGASNDLEIEHNGSDSYITSNTGNFVIQHSNNSGDFEIKANDFYVKSYANEKYIRAQADGSVELYYNDAKKLETRSNGITVTGYTYSDGVTIGNGTAYKYLAGSGHQLQMYHTGGSGNGYINNTQGTLLIGGPVVSFTNQANNAFLIRAVDGGTAELYFNGSKKFETTHMGGVLAGILTATTFDGNLSGGSVTGTTGTFSDTVYITDNIQHVGDSNTQIRFPAADTFSVDTGGSERLRITSNGRVGINSTSPTVPLDVVGSGKFSSALTVGGTLNASGTCTLGQTVSINGTNPRLQFVDTNHNPDFSIYGNNARFVINDDTNSAERFRIDSTGHTTIYSGTHDKGLDIFPAGNSQETRLRIQGKNSSGTEHTFNFNAKQSANRLDISGTGPICFIGSQNVGVHNAVPTSPLHVGDDTNPHSTKALLFVGPASGDGQFHLRGGSPTVFFDSTSSGNAKILTDNTALTISNGTLDSNGTERLRIDSAGRVMIGTTTEGFASYGDKFTIADSGHCGMTIRSGTSSYGTIYFSDGDDGSAAEVRGFLEYYHNDNQLSLGSNGSARLRIDSDGAVYIGKNPAQSTGTNTQNAVLTVKGYPASETSAAILALVRGNNTTSTAADHTMGRIVFADKQAGEYAFIEGEAEANGAVGDTPGRLVFSTAPDNSSAPTERLRIDSSGFVSIGRAGSALAYGTTNTRLEVKASDASNSIFETATFRGGADHNGAGARVRIVQGTHRGLVLEGGRTSNAAFGAIKISDQNGGLTSSVHIDSSGTWFWGKTSQSSGTPGVELYKDGPHFMTRSAGGGTVLGLNDSTGTSGGIMKFYYQDVHRGSLQYTGSTFQTATASDYRLKENDTPISDGITRVKQLRPIRFNWKTDASKTYDGFIAHEVTPVVPEAVVGERDGEISERGEGYQMLCQQTLIPLLTAALKEEIAKREALEARIAALEGS